MPGRRTPCSASTIHSGQEFQLSLINPAIYGFVVRGGTGEDGCGRCRMSSIADHLTAAEPMGVRVGYMGVARKVLFFSWSARRLVRAGRIRRRR